jgi:hypothetical protein
MLHVGLLVVDPFTDTRTVTVSDAGTLAATFTYMARIVAAAGARNRAVDASVALTVLFTPKKTVVPADAEHVAFVVLVNDSAAAAGLGAGTDVAVGVAVLVAVAVDVGVAVFVGVGAAVGLGAGVIAAMADANCPGETSCAESTLFMIVAHGARAASDSSNRPSSAAFTSTSMCRLRRSLPTWPPILCRR